MGKWELTLKEQWRLADKLKSDNRKILKRKEIEEIIGDEKDECK